MIVPQFQWTQKHLLALNKHAGSLLAFGANLL